MPIKHTYNGETVQSDESCQCIYLRSMLCSYVWQICTNVRIYVCVRVVYIAYEEWLGHAKYLLYALLVCVLEENLIRCTLRPQLSFLLYRHNWILYPYRGLWVSIETQSLFGAGPFIEAVAAKDVISMLCNDAACRDAIWTWVMTLVPTLVATLVGPCPDWSRPVATRSRPDRDPSHMTRSRPESYFRIKTQAPVKLLHVAFTTSNRTYYGIKNRTACINTVPTTCYSPDMA
jgi:hypothetical protein